MLSGGWVQMPDAQKRGARAGHARALVRVVQARRSPGVGSGAYVSPEAAVPRSLSLPLAPQRSAPRPEAAAVPPAVACACLAGAVPRPHLYGASVAGALLV